MNTRKLFQLELKKNKLIPYYWTAVLGTLFTLMSIALCYFSFLFDPEIQEVDSLDFLLRLGFGTLTAIYLVMSSTMAARYAVSDYSKNRALLLFSYPVSRKKMMSAKLYLIFGFSFITMVASSLVVFLFFVLLEVIFPVIQGEITLAFLWQNLFYILLYSFIAAGGGIIALWITFSQKSVISTVVSGIILMVIVEQMIGSSFFSFNIVLLVICFFLTAILSFFGSMNLKKQVETMEV